MARAVQVKPRFFIAEKLCVFVNWWFVALFSGDALMNTGFPDDFSAFIPIITFICFHLWHISSFDTVSYDREETFTKTKNSVGLAVQCSHGRCIISV
jgi:hypothetical protein